LQEADRRKDEFLATLATSCAIRCAPINAGPAHPAIVADPRKRRRRSRSWSGRSAQMVRLVDDLLDVGAHHDRQGRSPLRADRDLAAAIRDAVETTASDPRQNRVAIHDRCRPAEFTSTPIARGSHRCSPTC
jgi:hypothetical protein